MKDVPDEGPGYSPDNNDQWGWFIIACGLALSILMLMCLAGLAAGNGIAY